jgi:DNA-binding NtrC family response regulator
VNLPAQSKTRIMVVDDDAICLEVTRDRLKAAGYEVIVRDSALGTSAAILRERPHVVLLDQDMPGLTGEQLAQLLRGQGGENRAALILYSSEPLSRLSERAKRCGAAGFIEKTSSDQRFLQQLSDCLRDRARSVL